MTEIMEIQEWYDHQCDGDWEHQYGLTISTLDNPGWSLKIDLVMTNLEKEIFTDVKINRSEDDWVVARKNGLTFECFGGSKNLSEMIRIFLDWEQNVSRS